MKDQQAIIFICCAKCGLQARKRSFAKLLEYPVAAHPAGMGLFSSFEGTDHSDRLHKTFDEVQTVRMCS
jgi:hypothetical protein